MTKEEFVTQKNIKWTDPKFSKLYQTVRKSFPFRDPIIDIVRNTPIELYYINWEQAASSIWHDVLQSALSQCAVPQLVASIESAGLDCSFLGD